MSEASLKRAHDWLGDWIGDYDINDPNWERKRDDLGDLLDAWAQEARLDEAKWWSANSRGLMIPEAHQVLNQRIAELERAASMAKGGKGA